MTKTACEACGSEHCGGGCYLLPTNPYMFKDSAEGPRCPAPCDRPAHFHDTRDPAAPRHWCMLHAPSDIFPLSVTERGRFKQAEFLSAARAALHFMREEFLKPSHVPLGPEGACPVCDKARRILFQVAELEGP